VVVGLTDKEEGGNSSPSAFLREKEKLRGCVHYSMSLIKRKVSTAVGGLCLQGHKGNLEEGKVLATATEMKLAEAFHPSASSKEKERKESSGHSA